MAAPMPRPLWPSWQDIVASTRPAGAVVIDLHGESPWEKASFAAAIDGQVAGVLGTHTHDPTCARPHPARRRHRLRHRTLGMTGRLGHTDGGFDPMHFVAKLRGEDHTALPAYTLAEGPLALGAVVLDNRTPPARPRRSPASAEPAGRSRSASGRDHDLEESMNRYPAPSLPDPSRTRRRVLSPRPSDRRSSGTTSTSTPPRPPWSWARCSCRPGPPRSRRWRRSVPTRRVRRPPGRWARRRALPVTGSGAPGCSWPR